MDLFKQNKNQEKTTLKEAWKDPKKKAIIKLSMWAIFIFVLLLATFIASKIDPSYFQNNDEEELSFQEISQMQEEILKNNFSYEYNITVNNDHYLFKGDKDGTKDIGYKEAENGIEKYYIENDTYYTISLNNAIEIDSIFTGINENYIDFVYLFNLFYESPTESINENVRHLVYKINNMTMTITTNQKNITKIVLEIGEDIYSLKYDNINKIDELESPVIQPLEPVDDTEEQIDLD